MADQFSACLNCKKTIALQKDYYVKLTPYRIGPIPAKILCSLTCANSHLTHHYQISDAGYNYIEVVPEKLEVRESYEWNLPAIVPNPTNRLQGFKILEEENIKLKDEIKKFEQKLNEQSVHEENLENEKNDLVKEIIRVRQEIKKLKEDRITRENFSTELIKNITDTQKDERERQFQKTQELQVKINTQQGHINELKETLRGREETIKAAHQWKQKLIGFIQ